MSGYIKKTRIAGGSGVNAEKTSSERRFEHAFKPPRFISFSEGGEGGGGVVHWSRPAHGHPEEAQSGSLSTFLLYHTLSVSFVNPKDL